MANDFNYGRIEFPVREKSSSKLEKKNSIYINVFCYENILSFLIYISDQKFENSMDLLLIINENKSHYICIKHFDRFMFHKAKNKNKNHFFKSCLQCFSTKNVLTELEEICLIINGAQSVGFKKGTIEFNFFFNPLNTGGTSNVCSLTKFCR